MTEPTPRITPDQLAYHLELVARVKTADAAWRSWAQHLARVHALGPADHVTEAGDIVRVPTETADG